MMKHRLILTVVAALACLNAWGEAKLLAAFDGRTPPESLAALNDQPQFEIAFEPAAGADGRGSIVITCHSDEAAEALFLGAPLSGSRQRVLWFKAHWKGEAVDNKAYLEMLVTTPDGNTYFSRGLEASQIVAGPTDWHECRIPFYLKAGETAVSVRAGVRFEGRGVVRLDEAAITEDTSAACRSYGISTSGVQGLTGALGGFLGGMLGCWAGLAGTWSAKGKRQRAVIVLGAATAALCVLTLATALVLLASGAPRGILPLALLPALYIAIMAAMIPRIRRQYARAEALRMQALDQSEGL